MGTSRQAHAAMEAPAEEQVRGQIWESVEKCKKPAGGESPWGIVDGRPNVVERICIVMYSHTWLAGQPRRVDI